MKGTIIEVNREKDYCLCHSNTNFLTYKTELGTFKDNPNLTVGCDCIFEPIKDGSAFSIGSCKLEKIFAIDYSNTKVLVTTESKVPDYKILEQDKNYLVCGEGRYEREARAAMIELAIESNVNCLLEVSCETVRRPGIKNVLYRCTGRPAVVTGEHYQPEPGIHMNLPTKLARRNSPNEASVRYNRVLIISILMIMIPCLTAMGDAGMWGLTKSVSQAIIGGFIVLGGILFMFSSFQKRKSFLLTLKPVNK